jgi:hypothetical protein
VPCQNSFHSLGAENPVTLGDLGMLADQTAEPVPADDPDVCAQGRSMRAAGRRTLLQHPVRPGCVVVPQVLGQHPSQVVLIDDQHPVQELPARVPIILSQMQAELGR